MIVRYKLEDRYRVEFNPDEYAALASLAASLFEDGKTDPLSRGMQKVGREYRLDLGEQPSLPDSVPNGGHVTATAPSPSSGGRSE